ncbi:hypothetical protein ABZP36_005250 [Zizania latifolia]
MFLRFLAMFAAIYLIGYMAIFRRWSNMQRTEASSSFTSLFHGTAAVLALHAMLTIPHADNLAAPNTPAPTRWPSTSAWPTSSLTILPSESLFMAHHLDSVSKFVKGKEVLSADLGEKKR